MKRGFVFVLGVMVSSYASAWTEGSFQCDDAIVRIRSVAIGPEAAPYLMVETPEHTIKGLAVALTKPSGEESLMLSRGSAHWIIRFDLGGVQAPCRKLP